VAAVEGGLQRRDVELGHLCGLRWGGVMAASGGFKTA